jgi:SNF2 family DNA or RNA helicase
MTLKEYVQRGMVKTALILTPTPLVSQWQEELRTKFDLEFLSTNDPDYRTDEVSFWKRPFILSSVNIAKSKKNIPLVVEREYDMVIVDEAHHLKNRNTLNWKLVNSLKKRFLLLLTATPVENNLMEIYNLVTLLRPGQLKTASHFRNEFMTRGDPADPKNRGRLRELLCQVMIRNTRALARVDIPPRFARTIRVAPLPLRLDLYERMLNRLDHFLAHEKEITAIHNLCNSLDRSSKNARLFDIIKKSPGKKIIFVNFRGTLDHVSEFLSRCNIPHAVFHGGLDTGAGNGMVLLP